MKKIIIAVCIISIFSYQNPHSCSFNYREIKGIHILYSVPIVNWDGSILEGGSEYDIFYYKELTMYRLPYRFDSTLNGKLLLREERTRFLIVQADSPYGYLFYPKTAISSSKVNVDSILALDIQRSMYDSLNNIKPDSLYYDSEKNWVKVFKREKTIEYPEEYTLYFYYSKKLKNVSESFSKMDNVKHMKLFKIRLVAHGAYWEQYKMNFPRRELRLEMSKLNVSNREEILEYFKKYKEKGFYGK